MTIETSDAVDEEAWDALAQRHPAGTIYHSTRWARTISAAFGVRPFWLILKDSAGSMVGGLPVGFVDSHVYGRKLSAFPCAQYCDPLIPSDNALPRDVMALIAQSLVRLRRRVRASSVELRLRRPWAADSFSDAIRWSFCTHDVNLGSSETDLLHTFHKSCIQRPIASAERREVRLHVGSSEDDVKYFYRLYALMRKSSGLLPAPYSFFLILWQFLSSDGSAEFLHAVSEGRIVSSVLILNFGQTATYEYGATRADSSGLHPSQFLLWEAMKRARSRGCTTFNLGRTARENRGLLQYKQRWGGRLVPIVHLNGDDGSPRNGAHALRTATAVGMKVAVALMPMPVCEWLGDRLYAQTL